MASVYVMGQLPIKIFNKEVDYEADTIKLMLLSSSATPNVDTHVYLADVEGDEVSGTGYVAGGETLTGKTISYNSGTDTTSFDADDVTWSSSTITARYGILYVDTGDSSTSPIIAYMDFDAEKSSSSGDFTVQFNASGIFTATV